MINKEMQYDLLVTALEGGSNYWYTIITDLTPIRAKYKTDQMNCTMDWVWAALQDGVELTVADNNEEPDEILGKLTKKGMNEATKVLIEKYPHILGEILQDNWDANTADCWLQCAIMKEIVFG